MALSSHPWCAGTKAPPPALPGPNPALSYRAPEEPRGHGFVIAEALAVYRPRHPERSAFYQLLDQHFERYLLLYEERYERRSGPFRPVVKQTVEAYLDCGRLENGFARLVCPACKGEHLLAFSCQTRNFCPTCQAKRAALFAERLREDVLAPVPHRHLVFTIPKALRGIMQRERRLLSILARMAFLAMRHVYAMMAPEEDGRPGMVAAIQTFGALANWNSHIHAIVTDGLLKKGGGFILLACPDTDLLEQVFRRLLIRELERHRRLSPAFAASLLTWKHSGFSVYARQVIPHDDPAHLEHIARYLTRPPVRQQALTITEAGTALLETPPHPINNTTFKEFDPLDWVHALCQQIPQKGQHLVRYYGAYANRVRATYRANDPPSKTPPLHEPTAIAPVPEEDEGSFTRSRRRSWARLLRKLLEVDPLLCPNCRVLMRIIAVIQDPRVIDRILRHLGSGRGHDPFEARAPPAA